MPTKHLKSAQKFAKLMDSQFSIFGIRFGLDSILGLIPGAGDISTLLLSLYLIWVGIKMKLPAKKILQMVFNIVVDTLIGAIPLVGDISDVFYKANIKNLRILEETSKGL